MLGSLKWSQVERGYLLKALALNRIPRAFVDRHPSVSNTPPVLAQHAPGPLYMNGKLDRIVASGYRTFDTKDLEEWSAGRDPNPEPGLLLTFDDGLRRFKDVTFPHLQARGMKSVIFVCAGLVEIASGSPSKLRDYVRSSILTWDELKSLQDTGLLDVQSHGMWHHMVPVSGEVSRIDNRPPPTVIEAQELLPPPRGLASFFEQSDARVSRRRSRPFFLTSHAQCSEVTVEAQQADMIEARQLIAARLPGSVVRAFAFPWWNGTSSARQAVYRAGYTQLYEGARSLKRSAYREKFASEPIGRLSFDFIDCLPGDGRRGVYDLMLAKQRGEYGNDLD